ncbi:MAG: sigma 54-interacting transcriptional regulator [Candidatus Hydrothermia bacterium]
MLEKLSLEDISISTLVIDVCNLLFELVSEALPDIPLGIILTKPSGQINHVLSKGVKEEEISAIISKLNLIYECKNTPLDIGNFEAFPLCGKFSTFGFIFVQKSGKKTSHLMEKASNVITKLSEILSFVDYYLLDPSTGLPGKKYLTSRIDEQIQRKIRYGENFALVLIKLVNYEDVAKNYSDQAPEILMRNIGDFLRKFKRKSDILTRFDKDKFAILMPHSSSEAAKSFINRLESALNFETFQVNHFKIKCDFEIGGVSSEEIDTLEHDEVILNALLLLGSKRTGSHRKSEKFSFEIIGDSEKMLLCKEEILVAAQTDMTVLILGETGTGKELVARKIHELSERRDKPFVIIDCAAIPDTLLESELFGHEKGAFTGATSRKIGLFESAEGGTVFLDEIESTSPSMQAKLLRAIEDKTIRRVGGTELIPINVRIISASNVDLEEEVKKGNFRKDLYYRISGMVIKLPPLRERKQDIPALVNYFIRKISIEQGKIIKGVTPEVYEILQAYDWPGNVRELEKEVERMIAFTEDGGYITEDKISPKIRPNTPHTFTLDELLDNYEKNIIIDALMSTNWNETKAAKLLGISRTNLIAKIKKHALKKPGSLESKN